MIKALAHLKFRLFDSFDPGLIELDDAIRVTLSAIFALIFVRFSAMPEAGWTIIVAPTTAFLYRGASIKRRLLMFAGYSFACLISLFLGTTISQFVAWYGLLIFGVVFLVFLQFPKGFDIYASGVFALFIMLFAGTFPMTYASSIQRLEAGLVGVGFALLAIIIWPYRPAKALRNINRLLHRTIVNYIHWIFAENIYGNNSTYRLLKIKNYIYDNVQKAWGICGVVPNHSEELKLGDNANVFGGAYIVGETLAACSNKQSFASLAPHLHDIFRLTQKVAENWLHNKIETDGAYTELSNLLHHLREKYAHQKEILIFIFAVQHLADLMVRKEGANNDFFA